MTIRRVGKEKIADLLKRSRNPHARAAVPHGTEDEDSAADRPQDEGRREESAATAPGASPQADVDSQASASSDQASGGAKPKVEKAGGGDHARQDENGASASPAAKPKILVKGLPSYLPEVLVRECETQIEQAVEELIQRTGLEQLALNVGTAHAPPVRDSFGLGASVKPPQREKGAKASGRPPRKGPQDEPSVEERAEQYEARKPLYDFDFLVAPEHVKESLLSAVDLIKVEQKVFDTWNLRSIEPFPRSALNFYGPSGTGKTLAAHAVASYLNKSILAVSYAEIESKYVGDSSKNIEAVFFAAERDKSVLFVDEADSLLSKRLTDVSQGAEQAINSMRSQLLICMERYKGIAIFSTNLVENYDQAFQTRMRYIHFPLPDEPSRREIWKRHLPPQLPLGSDVSLDKLAHIDDLCGRDIKNAVIDTALRAARSGAPRIRMQDLVEAVERVKHSRIHTRGE
ncbi:MAG TPA: ATP-binding protein [Acidobacteriota bacterium]|nr:ATP-binding protein [Acidobacteriota bacterium]